MNLPELRSWAESNDGTEAGRSLFHIDYDDGRRGPIIVERHASRLWTFWSGRGWRSPKFATRNEAARALVCLIEQYEAERESVRQSGIGLKFDAEAALARCVDKIAK